jgi:hypothetical protein
MRCTHCERRPASSYLGLCRGCHRYSGVRARLIAASPGARLPEPTNAAPGSEEKILILQARVSAHQDLHHPLDAGVDRPAWVESRRPRYAVKRLFMSHDYLEQLAKVEGKEPHDSICGFFGASYNGR